MRSGHAPGKALGWRVAEDRRGEPPALVTRCCFCEEEVATTAGAVIVTSFAGEDARVAHGRCWRESRSLGPGFAWRRKAAGWLLAVHAASVIGALWALGGDRYGLAVALAVVAGLAVFLAWESEVSD